MNEKPKVQLSGANGNVYNLLAICVQALRNAGMRQEADKLKEDVFNAESYDHTLELMQEAVDAE